MSHIIFFSKSPLYLKKSVTWSVEDQLIPQAEERSSNPCRRFYSAAEPESASPSRADLFMFPCPHCSHRALRWHSTIPWTKRAGKLYCITEHLGLLPKISLKEKKWFDKSKVVILNQYYADSRTKRWWRRVIRTLALNPEIFTLYHSTFVGFNILNICPTHCEMFNCETYDQTCQLHVGNLHFAGIAPMTLVLLH